MDRLVTHPRRGPRSDRADGDRGRAARSRRSAATSPPTRSPASRPRRTPAPRWTGTQCAPPTSRGRACCRSPRRSTRATSPRGRSSPGEAARIFTGATLPDGADAVVREEATQAEGTAVRFAGPARPGENVRRAGEDVTRGGLALAAGARIGARQAALLAAVGVDRVAVRRVARASRSSPPATRSCRGARPTRTAWRSPGSSRRSAPQPVAVCGRRPARRRDGGAPRGARGRRRDRSPSAASRWASGTTCRRRSPRSAPRCGSTACR